MKRAALLILAIMSTAGTTQCSFFRVLLSAYPQLQCSGFISARVIPGSCRRIPNPCESPWTEHNGFALTDPPEGIYARREVSSQGETAWSICALAATATTSVRGTDVGFTYVRDRVNIQAVGEESIDVVVGDPPTVTINQAGSYIEDGVIHLTLSATGLGGFMSFTYLWTPSGQTDSAIQVSPSITTTYTVEATDAEGFTASARLTIDVDAAVTAFADPLVIDPGASSQMTAVARGGTPPYTFAWSPATGLDDPNAQNPTATLSDTQDYRVTATDSAGVRSVADIRVYVIRPRNPLLASFTVLRGAHDVAAQTIHWTFDASASTGPITGYTWHVTRNNTTVLDTVTTGPVFEVDLPETVTQGNMALTVGAADGTTSSISQAFR